MRHQTISFIKSGVRIVGYLIMPVSLPLAALTLIASEAVGVLEEVGCE